MFFTFLSLDLDSLIQILSPKWPFSEDGSLTVATVLFGICSSYIFYCQKMRAFIGTKLILVEGVAVLKCSTREDSVKPEARDKVWKIGQYQYLIYLSILNKPQ